MSGVRGACVALCLILGAGLSLGGCAHVVSGSATWPGARIQRALLTAADFPAGVQYHVVPDEAARPDGVAGPPAMLSRPQGCSEGLTRLIVGSAERGAGSALKYVVGYDGARILVTVSSWRLDLDALAGEARRCARFEAFFDPNTEGIPITTTQLDPGRPDALAYRQTMRLGAVESSVLFWFADVDSPAGSSSLFAVAFPTPNPTIPVRADLPDTFFDLARRQADRLQGG